VLKLWHRLLARFSRRDRGEVILLLTSLVVVVLALTFLKLASEVFEGETRAFDERILRALRKPDNPAIPIGPSWLRAGALDITALGSPTVLGLLVLGVTGYLVLQGLYRTSAFVFVASCGGWVLNWALKQTFSRTRPDIVPHLREVGSFSFPSGHALTSAAVCLTLGALLMRIAKGRLAKFYCMFVAMLVTFLVGVSRLYLGVHYPTDVLAGWLIGLSWALLCWMIEWAIERRAGLKREQQQKRAD
jgi:undecaprenyl-diphosphatase